MSTKKNMSDLSMDAQLRYKVSLYHKSGKAIFVAPHCHDYLEILYVTSGQLSVEITDAIYTVDAGNMLVLFSDEVHSINTCFRDENSFVEIHYDYEILLSSANSVSDNKFLFSLASAAIVSDRLFTKDVLANTKIPTLISDLQKEVAENEFGVDIAVRLYLCQLSLWILRYWKTKEDDSSYPSLSNLDNINTLQKIFKFVDSEYTNKIKMETIANQLNMSYYSFSKFFIANTNKTFPAYVNEVRLTKSKILLTTTGMNITEIALDVGFISTSHFIQRFKESNQMTPQQFRKEFVK